MEEQYFNIRFQVDQSASEVFDAVTNVRAWWSEALEGDSVQLGDEFSYRHGTVHYSKHKLIDVIPNQKVVWLTLESSLTFVEKQDEWNRTTIVFEITTNENKTFLTVSHLGLVPSLQCFNGCSKGWTYYLQNSLLPLITSGKGNPDKISDHNSLL